MQGSPETGRPYKRRYTKENFIPEGDLYRLIARSNLQDAFRKDAVAWAHGARKKVGNLKPLYCLILRKRPSKNTEEIANITIMKSGETWWVLKDVCERLEFINCRMVAERLDEDEKGVSIVDTLGGKARIEGITDIGLYIVILFSRNPEARQFKSQFGNRDNANDT